MGEPDVMMALEIIQAERKRLSDCSKSYVTVTRQRTNDT
jgi:hypothetical protein